MEDNKLDPGEASWSSAVGDVTSSARSPPDVHLDPVSDRLIWLADLSAGGGAMP